LTRVACACRDGTEGTRRCNYGRLCGTLTVDGRDVGDVLIGEGLAHRYTCSGDRCPRRPGWC
jgi:endonuclease YncB( thermonuclease family)